MNGRIISTSSCVLQIAFQFITVESEEVPFEQEHAAIWQQINIPFTGFHPTRLLLYLFLLSHPNTFSTG